MKSKDSVEFITLKKFFSTQIKILCLFVKYILRFETILSEDK